MGTRLKENKRERRNQERVLREIRCLSHMMRTLALDPGCTLESPGSFKKSRCPGCTQDQLNQDLGEIGLNIRTVLKAPQVIPVTLSKLSLSYWHLGKSSREQGKGDT